MKIEVAVRIFVDKMKRISLKRRLDEDDLENDLEASFPPVNEDVDEVAPALSESLVTFINRQKKPKK